MDHLVGDDLLKCVQKLSIDDSYSFRHTDNQTTGAVETLNNKLPVFLLKMECQ